MIPANATERKNKTANSLPIGIRLKIPGIVMNMRGGPDFGSIPNANTAGIIANAGNTEQILHKSDKCLYADMIFSFYD